MKRVELECAQVEPYLPVLVGGELEDERAEQVFAHLERCSACDQSLAALRAALSGLTLERARRDPRVDLWPALERELLAAGRIRTPAAISAAARPQVAQRSAVGATSTVRVAQARGAWLRRTTVLAAAAALAVVAWRWEPAGDALPSAPRIEAGPDVATQVQPHTSVEALRSASGAALQPARDVALAGHVGVGGAPAPAHDAQVAAPAVEGSGLRRVAGDEALLRDTIDSAGARRDYSLAGSRGLR